MIVSVPPINCIASLSLISKTTSWSYMRHAVYTLCLKQSRQGFFERLYLWHQSFALHCIQYVTTSQTQNCFSSDYENTPKSWMIRL